MPTDAVKRGWALCSDNRTEDLVALLLAEILQFFPEGVVLEGQDGHRVERSVLRSVDGHRRDGDAGGHLDDGQEGIQAVQGLGFHRNADDRKRGQRGDHARQVRGSAGPRYDDVESVVPRGPDIIRQRPGVPVRAEDTFFVGDAELLEGGARRGHDVPVAGAAHDNGYLAHKISTNEAQIYGESPSPANGLRIFFNIFFNIRKNLPAEAGRLRVRVMLLQSREFVEAHGAAGEVPDLAGPSEGGGGKFEKGL